MTWEQFNATDAMSDPASRCLTWFTGVVGIAGAPVAKALESPTWVTVSLAAIGLAALIVRGVTLLGAVYLDIRKSEAAVKLTAVRVQAGQCPYSPDGTRACEKPTEHRS